jgi:hypothetical protein
VAGEVAQAEGLREARAARRVVVGEADQLDPRGGAQVADEALGVDVGEAHDADAHVRPPPMGSTLRPLRSEARAARPIRSASVASCGVTANGRSCTSARGRA